MSYGGSSGGSALFSNSDVALNAPNDGQLLAYNGSTQKWTNSATNLSQIATTSFVQAANTMVAGTNTQTGASYTLIGSDAGKAVEMNSAGANTVTVPVNASVPYAIGTIIEICQYGIGATTIAAASGVTIRNAASGLKIQGQYGVATLRKRAADEWIIAGYLGT